MSGDGLVANLVELRAHLTARGESQWALPDGVAVRRKSNVQLANPEIEVRWNQPFGVVHFTAGIGLQVPAKRRPALAELVCRIDAQLAVHGLQLREGGLAFHFSAFLDHDGRLSTRAIDSALDLCAATTDKYYPLLAAACAGKELPEFPAALTG